MYNNTTGYNNTASGYDALVANTTGFDNTASGFDALYYNTIGDYNTASGYDALYYNTTGSDNTASGFVALYSDTTGSYNTASGFDALFSNTDGSDNTASGFNGLIHNTSGSDNTALGYFADVNAGNYGNVTVVGSGAMGTAGNQVRIGNSSVTSIGGYASWSNISDGRVKKNIKENVPGLAFINKLKPVTYNLDLDAADKIIQKPVLKDKEAKLIQPSQEELTARKDKEQIVYTGFIAQDVEKAAKELNYDFSGVDAAKNDKDLYGLRYGDFVVPLVKAVQELSKMNDSLKSENDVQQKINANIQREIDELKTMIQQLQQCTPCNQQSIQSTHPSSANDAHQIISLSGVSLEQNIPNPFTNTTIIGYSLPNQFTSAQIVITDKNGKTLKTINISGTGKGQVNVDASILASGAYNYALYVDGKFIASKQMVLSK
jgi:hypothetical protein